MMMDPLEQVRRLATRGKALTADLQPLKYQATPRHVDERKTSSGFGPSGPAVGESAIDLELDLSRSYRGFLVTYVYDSAFEGVATPPTSLAAMFDWVYEYAYLVPDAGLQELVLVTAEAVYQLNRFITKRTSGQQVVQGGGNDVGEAGVVRGRWTSAQDVCFRLARVGLEVTPNQLRLWASRGHIGKVKDGRHNLYCFSQVVGYLKTRPVAQRT